MLAVGEHALRNLDRRVVRMTSGLAGGVGGTHQEMCGALSAGVMLIGALHGRSSSHEDDQPAFQLATRYRRLFAEEFGTTRCAPLRDQVHAPGGLGSCSFVAQRAALILLDVLAAQGRGSS
jgi:C_GCAxxG_C_C family probable redox protein